MPEFRYAQFCPLARAAELVGERWTLLVVRELLLGPQRFSDLRRRLPGLSSSVLAERLARLEERGLVARRAAGPPAPAALYELTETGRALRPVAVELARWGLRFLGSPQPGDHFEPDWVRLGLACFARTTPSPARAYAIRIPDGDGEVAIHVAGGRRGTVVREGSGPADVSLRAHALAVLGLASGGLDPRQALRSGQLEAEGDLAALRDFPALFETDFDGAGLGSPDVVIPNQKGK